MKEFSQPVSVRVSRHGELLAESDRAVLLREGSLPPRYYLPVEDVRAELVPSERTSRCPWKGDASYWSVRIGDDVVHDIVWSYADPLPEAEAIRGLVAFWTGRDGVEADAG